MSAVPTLPFWSVQEPGQSYLEKAEKMYAQMYSTREKVRAAPSLGRESRELGTHPLSADMTHEALSNLGTGKRTLKSASDMGRRGRTLRKRRREGSKGFGFYCWGQSSSLCLSELRP